jgi:hypothetical protein
MNTNFLYISGAVALAAIATAFGAGCGSDEEEPPGFGAGTGGTTMATLPAGTGAAATTTTNPAVTTNPATTPTTTAVVGADSTGVGSTAESAAADPAAAGTVSTTGDTTTASAPASVGANNGYYSGNNIQGYAFTVVEFGTVLPACNEEGTAECFQNAGTSLCMNGTLDPHEEYKSFAMLGINVNQAAEADSPKETAVPTGAIKVSVSGTGMERVQIQATQDSDGDGVGDWWCAKLPEGGTGTIPLDSFNTECWDNGGDFYDGTTPLEMVAVHVPGEKTESVPFDFCVTELGWE